jgi:branched-chain amino acid transport system substrate-binding protein
LIKRALGLENKRSTLGIIGIIVIAIGLGSFFLFEESFGRDPIKIGVILSETGPSSGIGIEERDGMIMAVDEINARGGINGRPIELIIVDNESNPEKAKSHFLVYAFSNTLNTLPIPIKSCLERNLN